MSLRSSSALLPTGTTINPSAPEDATYYDPEQTLLVVENDETHALRALTSFGSLGASWSVGTVHEIHHDQTLRRLGWFKVVGVVDFRSGERTGKVPARKIPHYVFK